jgi:hypothetical protein
VNVHLSSVYEGNSFNVSREGESWAIWRFLEDGEVEKLQLDTEAMDDLDSYFTRFYAEDRT